MLETSKCYSIDYILNILGGINTDIPSDATIEFQPHIGSTKYITILLHLNNKFDTTYHVSSEDESYIDILNYILNNPILFNITDIPYKLTNNIINTYNRWRRQ